MEDEKKEVRMDSFGRVLKTVEEKKDDEKPPTDSYGRVIKTVPTKAEVKKNEVKMIAGKEEQQKVYDMGKEDDDGKFVKHESFDHFVAEIQKKCQQNGSAPVIYLPEKNISYKVKYVCPSGSHKPFPLGMCQRCLPPTVILNR